MNGNMRLMAERLRELSSWIEEIDVEGLTNFGIAASLRSVKAEIDGIALDAEMSESSLTEYDRI